MNLEEKLAELCHEQDVRFAERMIGECYENPPPVPWPASLDMDSWSDLKRRAGSCYTDLSCHDREKYKAWARKYIALFSDFASKAKDLPDMYPDGVGVPPCTCRVAATLPDGTRYIGGVDDCPVHGFGAEDV